MPVLLFDLVNRAGLLSAADRERFWPMLRAAAAHLVREGPSVQQDRWENARGFTPFTLANMIAALIVAAQQADEQGESETGEFFRDTADAWCDSIDYWTYVHDTPLGRAVGVPGYYLRVAPPDQNGEPLKYVGPSTLQFRPARDQDRPPSEVVSDCWTTSHLLLVQLHVPVRRVQEQVCANRQTFYRERTPWRSVAHRWIINR